MSYVLNPIVQDQIDTLERRIKRSERRIERASRVEEVVEVTKDAGGKPVKTKTRVASPKDKATVAAEIKVIERLTAVIAEMRNTNALVFGSVKVAQPQPVAKPNKAERLRAREKV